MEDCHWCRTFDLPTSLLDDEEEPETDWAGNATPAPPNNICDICVRTIRTPCQLSEDFPNRHYLPSTVVENYDETPRLGVAPIPHQPSFDSLRASALAGCFICRALVGVILKAHVRSHNGSGEPADEKRPEWFTAARLIAQKYEKQGFIHVDFTHNISHDNSSWWFCPFDLVPFAEDEVRKLADEPEDRFKRLVNDTKTWTWECIRGHKTDQKWSSLSEDEQEHQTIDAVPESYPSRLLEISGPRLPDGSVGVRLVDTRETSCEGAYTALSHCWGDARFYVCNERTYNDLQRGISTSILSKTFRDAIRMTRALGLKYIWIDSLCIIQGDRDDWLHEGHLMDRVYSQACITLCATVSRDGNGGLRIDEKSPLLTRLVELDLLRPKGKYLVTKPDVIQWREEIDQAPLNKRAWTLQERLLPPRLMHFGQNQVFLECGHSVRCESLPQNDKPAEDGRFWVGKKINLDTLASFKRSEASYVLVWMQLVEAYSARALTYATDKLIAVSALAKVVTNENEAVQYHAGLFQPQIERQLLWAGSGSRHQEIVAPTWSWASTTGSITYSLRDFDRNENSDHYHLLLSVMPIQTEDLPDDASSTFTHFCLTIKGTLYPLTWTDLGCFETSIGFENRQGHVHHVRFKMNPTFDSPKDVSRENDHGVCFLPVLIRHRSTENKLYGILIRPVESEGSEMPRFERVGFADEYDSLLGCLGLTGRGKLDGEGDTVANSIEDLTARENEWLLEQKIDTLPYDPTTGHGSLIFLLQ